MNRIARTWREFAADHCSEMAAAIAYYVLFSFIPLITLMVAAFGLIMRDPAHQRTAVEQMLQLLPLQAGPGENLVIDSIRAVTRQSTALTLIGLVGLLWSSSGMFAAIRTALNVAWDVERGPGFVREKLLDLAAVIGLGILVVLSMSATVWLHALQTASIAQIGDDTLRITFMIAWLVLPAVISFLVFLLLYRYVPHVRHRTADVVGGALLATVLFEASKHGFAYYVSHFNTFETLYGALGAVLLFVLWTYIAAMALLIGAEFAAESSKGRPRVLPGQPPPLTPEEYAPRAARA